MIADNAEYQKQDIQDSCAIVHRDPKRGDISSCYTKSVESLQAEG